MTDRLADLLLRLAAHLAPPERRAWIRASGAEAEALEDPVTARRWAAGSLVAAMGWAVRKDLLFLAVLVSVGHWLAHIYGNVMDWMQDAGLGFFDAAHWSRTGCAMSLAALFAAWRSDRALLAALLTPLMAWEIFVQDMMTNGREQWLFNLQGLYDWVWPAAVGAGLGYLVTRWKVLRAPR